MNTRQHALAAEVRAEMGKQNVKAAHIQRALGISSTAWGTYFVQCNRDVPMSVVVGVAEYLGVPASVLLARAEAAQPAPAPDPEAVAEDALSQLPAASREAIRRVGEDLRPKFTGDEGNRTTQGA